MATVAAPAPAKPVSPGMYIFQGALASCMAVTVTNPLEVVKIRLQLQGELIRRGNFKVVYRNLPHGMYYISKHEGIRALQKGLVSAYWYQVFMNGTRLGLFDTMMGALEPYVPNPRGSFVHSVSCGALAGVIGAAVGSPFYLIKTRLQSAGAAYGHQYAYKNLADGLRQVYGAAGVRGLWRGADAAMTRTMIGSATQLTTYNFSKDLIRESGFVRADAPWMVEAGGAMLSGMAVAITMNPFDVISTRLYNQNVGVPLYNGLVDCMRKILASEGPLGFFKGLGAHYLRIGPHTFFTFICWDSLKRYMN